ncbi:MAG: competence protein ComEC family protein [Candidatus Omnitrophica bacterium]|nr:competence protein ComEC family protein [Candidatus Omnitrophota bacterium]
MSMMESPLVLICLSFIFGIILAPAINAPFLLLYSVQVFLLVLCALSFFRRRLFLFFLVFNIVLLGILCAKNQAVLPKNHIANYVAPDKELVTIQAVVDSEITNKKKKLSFICIAEKIKIGDKFLPVRGRVLVDCYNKDYSFVYGQEMLLTGRLYRPYPFAISDKLNYRQFLARQGIFAILSISKKGEVEFSGKTKGNILKRAADVLRGKAEIIIERYLSPQSRGIVEAMILGKRTAVLRTINQDFVRTGTVHILAVSGLHVGIVILIVMAGLSVAKITHKWRYLLAIFIIIFYCFFTGARLSVVRATAMACVFLIGMLLERDYEPYNALSLAALSILVANPANIYQAGFQLSFISVFSIFYLAGRIIKFIAKREFLFGVKSFLSYFAISLSAWLGTAGIVMYHFGIFSPVSVLANMMIIPFLAVIVVNGFLLIGLGGIFKGLGVILGASCDFFVYCLCKINLFLSRLPYAYFEFENIGKGVVVSYYFIIIAAVILLRVRVKRSERLTRRL